jgi:hypothetical protein
VSSPLLQFRQSGRQYSPLADIVILQFDRRDLLLRGCLRLRRFHFGQSREGTRTRSRSPRRWRRNSAKARKAALTWKPHNTVPVDDETGEKLLKLIDQLNEHDDVQNVYANFEVSDALVAKMGG